jgi:hypothetical protein
MGRLIRHTSCRGCETEIDSLGKLTSKKIFNFYYLGCRFEMCESCYNLEMKKMEVLIKAGFETDYDFSEDDSPEKI